MSMRQWLSVLGAGVVLLVAGVAGLVATNRLLTSESTDVGGVPVEVVRSGGSHDDVLVRRPAVVVVHGYAGSGRLMRPFADTLARRGYVVLLPDLAGHGANTRRLDVPSVIDPEIASVVGYARGLDDVDPDRVALLGHSMGAGAVVRVGAADPRIAATVAISLPGDDGGSGPHDLLLIVGALEPGGIRAATEHAAGSAVDRRLVRVPLVEHVTVLFAPLTHREAAAWLDAATGNTSPPWTGIAPLRRVLSGTALLIGALLLLVAAVGRSPRRRTAIDDQPAPETPRDRAGDSTGPRGRFDANSGPSARSASGGPPGRGAGADPRDRGAGTGPSARGDSRAARSVRGAESGPAGPGDANDRAAEASPVAGGATSAIARVRAGVLARLPIWVVAGLAGAPGVVGGAALSLVTAAPVTGYLIGYFALTGAVLMIAALLRTARARTAGSSLWSFGVRTAGTAAVRPRPWAVLVSAVAGGVAVVVPVQLGLTLMVPHGARWWLIPALVLATAALLSGARLLAGPGWDAAVLVVVSLPLPVAAVVGLAPGFLMLIAPLVAVLFVLYVGLAVLGRHSAWWHPIAAGAVMIAWPIAAALPVSVT